MEDKSRKIAIVGARYRDSDKDYKLCLEAFKKIFQDGDSIVSGGCSRGGDRFAQAIAKKLGLTITIHYPDWEKGKGAAFVRNDQIAKDCDVMIAVVAEGREGGTEYTLNKAKSLGKEVVVV